jgi:rhodanese-related sulfurtransferase
VGSDDPITDVDVREAARLRERDEALVLDVREQEEWDVGHIPGALFIPMGQVADRLDELPADRRILAVCRVGGRSGVVAEALRRHGYRVANVEGGMQEWHAAGLPMEPPGGHVA